MLVMHSTSSFRCPVVLLVHNHSRDGTMELKPASSLTRTPCNCVVKGRKGRFPAHFLSFPLIPVAHWAGGGAELGPREGFWRRFGWYWRTGERVWGKEVRGVGKWALGRLSWAWVAGRNWGVRQYGTDGVGVKARGKCRRAGGQGNRISIVGPWIRLSRPPSYRRKPVSSA